MCDFPCQCAGGVHGYCNCSITLCGMMNTGESSYCRAEPIKYVMKKTVYSKMSAISNSHLQQSSVSMAWNEHLHVHANVAALSLKCKRKRKEKTRQKTCLPFIKRIFTIDYVSRFRPN